MALTRTVYAAFGEGDDGTDDDHVDVSDDPHWSAVVGNPIEEVAVAFFAYYYDSSVRPWSFRVGVSGGGSATVALGEADGAEISYLPDNLVVIFDEATAREYRIVDALQSAWGMPVGG